MTAGTEIKCITDQDLLEFMRWVRDRGGECVCVDWEMKVLKIIRGTSDEYEQIKIWGPEEITLYSRDGVLGIVDTSHVESEDAEQKRRSELFRNPEGDLLQLGYEQDLRTR
ncbi:MAG: hypothetical protein J6Y57_01015 [Lachnospiraceae bacterium]|nr:hypothetical protein [Lachnospiraceae bacterium]